MDFYKLWALYIFHLSGFIALTKGSSSVTKLGDVYSLRGQFFLQKYGLLNCSWVLGYFQKRFSKTAVSPFCQRLETFGLIFIPSSGHTGFQQPTEFNK